MMDVRILLIGAIICLTQAYETSEPLHIVGSWVGGYDTDFSLHPTRFYNGWCIHIVMDKPVDCVLVSVFAFNKILQCCAAGATKRTKQRPNRACITHLMRIRPSNNQSNFCGGRLLI